MGKKLLMLVIKRAIIMLFGITIIFFTISCTKDTPLDISNSQNSSSHDMSDISGSYVKLFPKNKIIPDVSDLGRPLDQTVIWEHTIYGTKDGRHNTILYCFDPNNLKVTQLREFSAIEQEDYAGIRIVDDKITVKSRDGYYFLDDNLNQLGNKVAFPKQLQNELRRLDHPNGLYYNHFDISKDGQYVYFTDEHERSLFRYDLINKKKITLLSEIEIWVNPEPPGPESEKSRKLPYRLYNLLLTPNDQFLIAKIAGYMKAYYVFDLNQISQSFLIDYLPAEVNWSTIQNFIPIFNSPIDNSGSMANLNLAIMDLSDKPKTARSIPVAKDFQFDPSKIHATFNKNLFAFVLSNNEPPPYLKETVDIFDYNSKKSTQLQALNLDLSIVALLNDGRAIINYTNMKGDKKGFIITK